MKQEEEVWISAGTVFLLNVFQAAGMSDRQAVWLLASLFLVNTFSTDCLRSAFAGVFVVAADPDGDKRVKTIFPLLDFH